MQTVIIIVKINLLSLKNPAPPAPWNAPKPLMSTPVPRPNIRPPANGGPPQPPWGKQQGLLPPPGPLHGISKSAVFIFPCLFYF